MLSSRKLKTLESIVEKHRKEKGDSWVKGEYDGENYHINVTGGQTKTIYPSSHPYAILMFCASSTLPENVDLALYFLRHCFENGNFQDMRRKVLADLLCCYRKNIVKETMRNKEVPYENGLGKEIYNALVEVLSEPPYSISGLPRFDKEKKKEKIKKRKEMLVKLQLSHPSK